MTERASYFLTDLTAPADGRTDKKPTRSTFAALARKVERLSPCHYRPERFHESKSEIVAELRRLAGEARHG